MTQDSRRFGNFFLVDPAGAWAAVCVSKNACTSMKARVLKSAGRNLDQLSHDSIHDEIGYEENSPFLLPVGGVDPPPGLRFAVWRDPVRRCASVFHHFRGDERLTRHPGAHVATFDEWLDWIEVELEKPVLEQDEHVRGQCDYYRKEDVEVLVPIEKLDGWFESQGFGELARRNVREGRVEPTSAQQARIRRIYWRDYLELEPHLLGGPPPKRRIAGLWIGERLPPLARLSISSFLHHGFEFVLHGYGEIEGVPPGTRFEDAGELLSREEIFIHQSGSLAPAADRIRYLYLARHGGLWTDLDVVCLNPGMAPRDGIWFAQQSPGFAAVGLLAFPAGHPVMTSLADLAADPAGAAPWDSTASLASKAEWKRRTPDVLDRRKEADWQTLGPGGFTAAVRHFGVFGAAAEPDTLYPIPYEAWRRSFDASIRLDDPSLAKAWALHLWGEMLRHDPAVLGEIHPESVVAELMRRHGTTFHPSQAAIRPARLLIGVCSCHANVERRQAIRETWGKQLPEGVELRFFVGEGECEAADDLVMLPCRDDYPGLPAKVSAFFAHALGNHPFEWLLKCDDDTYVDVERVRELAAGPADLIGNEFIDSRGAPSGGAGYLLSRDLVTRIVEAGGIAAPGDEDVLTGALARKLGARLRSDWRLRYDYARYPRANNILATAHWCDPRRMRAIHAVRHDEPVERMEVRHPHWTDRVCFYEDGTFARESAYCGGTYFFDEGGITLEWFDWPPEYIPLGCETGEKSSPPNVSILIRLAGGMGNQMFQFAHGLALAHVTGAELSLGFQDFGRPFALDVFGLSLAPADPRPRARIECEDPASDREWPTLVQMRERPLPRYEISGYFQGEGFFAPVADRLRSIFRLPNPGPAPSEDGRPTVCFHVRLGDYVGSALHDVCTPAYFLDAMDAMRDLLGPCRFLVFSDGPESCRLRYGHLRDVEVQEESGQAAALAAMAGCDAFVLSNSTFGWWASWLAGDKPTIAPDPWLRERDWDIHRAGWMRLPAIGKHRWRRPRRKPVADGSRWISYSLFGTDPNGTGLSQFSLKMRKLRTTPKWSQLGRPALDAERIPKRAARLEALISQGIQPRNPP